jgi:hypothetical protein
VLDEGPSSFAVTHTAMQHTVKTQAIAVYRKLGVSSRNDAIDRASDLGLVDLGVLSSPPA